MKRIYILLVLTTIGLPFLSFSQAFQFGVKAGASVPDIKGNTEESKDYTSRLAPFFGVSFTRKISSNFNFQAEVNYSPQGGKRNDMQPIDATPFGLGSDVALYANFKNETKLNYLEVPLLIQFVTPAQKKDYGFFYFANFGPYVALRIKAETVTSGTSSIYLDKDGTMPLSLDDGTLVPPQSFDATTNIKDQIKQINFGMVGGLGSGYNFGGQKVVLEARFTRGLVNIQTHPEESGKNKTGSVIFSAGYIRSF